MIKKYETTPGTKLDFEAMALDSFINVKKKLEYPPVAISIGAATLGQNTYAIPFGTFGNFSCIVGASKSKKTFFKSLIIASFIGGSTTRNAPNIKGERDKDMFILDFDTEQGQWHSQNVFQRVGKLVGENYEYYKPFYLRKYDWKERLQFIEWCILDSDYRNNIGLISIDGFADLVKDVNDLEAANNLTQKLMKWSEVSKAHLTGVLHSNFGTSKPTGHLGSAILKKAETVCMLERDEVNEKVVNVNFPFTRSFGIESFQFIIGNNGLPIIL